jgi:PmbA protein
MSATSAHLDRSVDELQSLADRVVAGAQPGEQVEAFVSRDRETEVRVYEGQVEHFVSAESQGIGVRVIRDGRTGFAYAGTLDDAAIADVLAQARDNAGYGTPDQWAGLAEPDDVEPIEQQLWNDALMTVATGTKIDLTLQLERLTLGLDGRVRVSSANYADVASESAVASTTGIRRSGRENGCYLSVNTLADDIDDTQTGFGFSVGRSVDDLDLDRAARDAVDRATRLLGAQKPASGRSTVVFDPFVTAMFLGVIGGTLGGESVAKGRSLFKDRIGDTIAAAAFQLVDDPTNPLAYTASELDGEGLAARRNELVVDGVLQRFVHNSYSARRLGTVSTGNAVRGGFKGTPGVGCLALQLRPGQRQQAAIVGDIADGVLVQSLQGLHSGVNPVSGDFSVGASGLRITNGEVAGPLRGFTLASTLQKMLLDVVEVGADLEWLPMRAAGQTMVIADVTMSGS